MLSDRIAHIVVHRQRALWLALLAFLLCAAGIVALRARLNSDVLDMLPAHFESVGVYKIYDREFSQARDLIFGLRARGGDVDMDGFAAHFADALRKEPWVVRVMERSPIESPGGMDELRAVALPLMLNESDRDFARVIAALDPDAIKARMAQLRAKLESGVGISQTEVEYDPLGIVFPAMKELRAPKATKTADDDTLRVVFVHTNQPDLNEPACKAVMDQVADFKRRVVADWDGAAPEILCTGRTAYVAEMASKLKWDIGSTVASSIVLVALVFYVGFRRWRPLTAIVLALIVCCVGAVAIGAAVFGSLNMITVGLCAILVGLGVDFVMVLYALYAAEREDGHGHEQAIAAALRAHGRGIWVGAITTAGAFLCLLWSDSLGFEQLGVLIAIGIIVAAVAMMTLFWLFLGRNVTPRGASRLTAATGRYVAACFRHSRLLTWASLIALGALGAFALSPAGKVRFELDPKSLEPRNSDAGYALRTIMGRMNPDGVDSVMAVITAGSAEEFSRRWNAAHDAWEKLEKAGAIQSFQTPAGLATSPARMKANAAKLAALDFSAVNSAFDAALADGGFAADQFAKTKGMLAALADAAAGRLDVVAWRNNLPESSAWWFLIDGMISSDGLTGVARIKPLHTLVDAAEGSALREALAVPGVTMTISGWSFTLTELGPWAAKKLVELSVLMVGLNVVLLVVLLRAVRPVVTIMLGLALSVGALAATLKLTAIPLNLFNVLAFPLVLGVGVDYGIYLAIALRARNPRRELSSLVKPVLLSGLTTVAGFGSLAWAENPALSGLGLLCGIGVGWCLLTTFVFVLPVFAGAAGRAPSP